MADTLARRGPDGAGIWTDDDAGVGLGHRRLAVLDTSDGGRQPMVSHGGRFVITYNGTVYNFHGLRRDLEAAGLAPSWRGCSDTEVLLACIENWGVERTLDRVTGMFAFALWDRQTRTLTLARDRIGEKPLYYARASERFLFASDLDAIQAALPDGAEIDRDAVADLMAGGYIPAPRTIFCGVFKLRPGHLLVMRDCHVAEPRPYWTLGQTGAVSRGMSDDDVIDRTHSLIRDVVAQQTVSDVPLGAWLSGGIDSALIVAALQAATNRQVRTFTAGFDVPQFDEAPHAKAVARHLQTDHNEIYVGSADAAEIVPELPRIYSEPFADSSQISTAILARMTGRHVTVTLSGDGGDELFAGYPRYRATSALWVRMRHVPYAVRARLGRVMQMPGSLWDSVLPATMHPALNSRRMYRVGATLASRDILGMYRNRIRVTGSEEFLFGAPDDQAATDAPDNGGWIESLRRADMQRYLPDDLLVKTDRATMAVGLECRAPLLDHRLVEFAFGLPERVLVRDGDGKWVLRQALLRYLPQSLVQRGKKGFSVPLGHWLRGPLRGWASDMLAPERIGQAGFLSATKVSDAWREHLSGRVDRSPVLWNALMFQAWHAQFKARSPSLSDGEAAR